MTESDARRVDTETVKLQKEAAKLGRESSWYPFVVGSGVTPAITAIENLF